MNKEQLIGKVRKGTAAVVVAWYDGPYGERGTIVSQHKTDAAAQKAVNKTTGNFCGVVYI